MGDVEARYLKMRKLGDPSHLFDEFDLDKMDEEDSLSILYEIIEESIQYYDKRFILDAA